MTTKYTLTLQFPSAYGPAFAEYWARTQRRTFTYRDDSQPVVQIVTGWEGPDDAEKAFAELWALKIFPPGTSANVVPTPE